MLKNVGGLPTIFPNLADMVSSEMWISYPWRISVTNIPTGLIPLSDGVQDYSAPPNIYRLTQIGIRRLDTTPNQYRELDVSRDLSEDLDPRSYSTIRSACLQPSIGKLRLEAAVSVPSGTSLEMGGEYQMNPPKITSLTNDLWFEDQHFHVFVKGCMYWAYKMSDDNRAGGVVRYRGGQINVGQYAEYYGALERMAEAEDYGNIETMFPEQTIGAGRDATWSLNIFGS